LATPCRQNANEHTHILIEGKEIQEDMGVDGSSINSEPRNPLESIPKPYEVGRRTTINLYLK
jgi:hypothetical protein